MSARSLGSILLPVGAAVVLAVAASAPGWDAALEPLSPPELPPAPAGEPASCLEADGEGCAGIVYLWSDRMPLSLVGIDAIESAAHTIGIDLTLIESEDLAAHAETGTARTASGVRMADALLASGALAHAPALVVYADGRAVGPAILGYKTSEAYASAIRRRLSSREGMEGGDGAAPTGVGNGDEATPPDGRVQTVAEFDAVGSPGAYFRWVPGREAIAYESGGRIYLLDLSDGRSREAPGYVDFVPTPDGSSFVTPAPRRSGMEFYDAADVFAAAEVGEPGRVDPFFTDRAMRDQYPSVGILRQDGAPDRPGSRTVYRVLTSWFEGIAYRDYEATGRAPRVRPLAEPVEPCRDTRLSIPIMSQTGREVAARDESTGTTKIFRIGEAGRCGEVVDLGVQTGKVAWHSSGRVLAFARPPMSARVGPGGVRSRGFGGGRAGGGRADADAAPPDGIFVYDRDEERMSRVPGSEDASSLAFPEFIGSGRLVYLVPGGFGESSVFRVVEGGW